MTSMPDRCRRWFRKHPVMATLAIGLVVLFLAGGAFELAFRWQVVDFYATELAAFNRADELEAGADSTILVLGDSFSAGPNSYASRLFAGESASWRVINSAVPGTTVEQAARMAPGRLARFRPRLVVHQAYVGNDLLDLRHPVSWRRAAPLRNLYWLLLDSGASGLGFLNYRLGQLGNRALVEWWWDAQRSSPEHVAAVRERPFAVADYRQRERMLLAADPLVLHRQIAIEGTMAEAWARYRTGLERLAESCERADARLLVLVVPHCAQVHPRYRERFERLGGVFPQPELLEAATYPFLDGIREIAAGHAGVMVVDPLAALRQAEARGQALYLNNDAHLNEDGQEVLARVLRGRIS